MASAADSVTESPAEASGETVVKSGEVTYKGKPHQLILLDKGLRLVSDATNQESGASGEERLLDLSWRDVVCACPAVVKKSRSAAVPQENKMFVIHYIKRNPKSRKLRCASIQLEVTDASGSDVWIPQIEEKRKEGKPQKLLVVINPIGGKGTARQTYSKQVQPLFDLAGFETVVKVTERAKHALEIGKTFDISTVDGVVVVGGDGLYAELLHSIVLRAQEEARVDVNNPDAKLIPPTTPFGIIPAGTGNGVSGWLNDNVIDVETATLNIIRGEKNLTGMFSVHEPGKLVTYCGLLVANGYFSEVIKRTEELRWMKRARYPYAMITSMFGKKDVLEIEVDVLKESAKPQDESAQDGASAEAATSAWTKLGVKQVIAVIAFLTKIVDVGEDRVTFYPFGTSFDLMLMRHTSGFNSLKFLIGFATKKKSALETEYVEICRDIIGFRINTSEEQKKGEAGAANPGTDHANFTRLLDIDGELFSCSGSQFDVRLHSHFLQVFSVNTYKA